MNLMDKLAVEEERPNQELEGAHGDFEKTKSVFERKIKLYVRYLKKGELTNKLDRLRLENKKEWSMSNLLSLILHEETTTKFSKLTKRIYELERQHPA